MELGVFSLTELSGGQTIPDRIRNIIDFGAHADEAGLDISGIGEHHTRRFSVSSPAVVLAAIASRTSKITLTSAVSVPEIRRAAEGDRHHRIDGTRRRMR